MRKVDLLSHLIQRAFSRAIAMASGSVSQASMLASGKDLAAQ